MEERRSIDQGKKGWRRGEDAASPKLIWITLTALYILATQSVSYTLHICTALTNHFKFIWDTYCSSMKKKLKVDRREKGFRIGEWRG